MTKGSVGSRGVGLVAGVVAFLAGAAEARASEVGSAATVYSIPGAAIGVTGAVFGLVSVGSEDRDVATGTVVMGALNVASAVSYTSIVAANKGFRGVLAPVLAPLAIANAVVGTVDLSVGVYRLVSEPEEPLPDVHALVRAGPGSGEIILVGSF